MIEERTERLGRQVDPRWDAARVETGLAQLHRRIRNRRRRGVVAAASATALAAGALIYMALSPEPPTAAVRPPKREATPPARIAAPPPPPRPTSAPQVVTERATATPLSGDAIVRVYSEDERKDVVAMRVERGAVRFSVGRDPRQPFRVDAGPVIVEVLGTEFTVERDGRRTRVSVMEGVVRVRWKGGEDTLRAGESGRYPPAERSQERPPAASDVDDLLDEADQARLDGRIDDALSLIERALADAPDPTHEAAAAFTLGRVRARLGEHERAAQAFARARLAAPDGTLAEDALAREVEAWARAGHRQRAQDAARLYRSRYPNGRRSKMVHQFGAAE
jgi:transmembrane sensor